MAKVDFNSKEAIEKWVNEIFMASRQSNNIGTLNKYECLRGLQYTMFLTELSNMANELKGHYLKEAIKIGTRFPNLHKNHEYMAYITGASILDNFIKSANYQISKVEELKKFSQEEFLKQVNSIFKEMLNIKNVAYAVLLEKAEEFNLNISLLKEMVLKDITNLINTSLEKSYNKANEKVHSVIEESFGTHNAAMSLTLKKSIGEAKKHIEAIVERGNNTLNEVKKLGETTQNPKVKEIIDNIVNHLTRSPDSSKFFGI